MCKEWNSELWLALVDFEKAFDTVEHDALWQALAARVYRTTTLTSIVPRVKKR